MPPPIRRTGPHNLLDLSEEFPILHERIYHALNAPRSGDVLRYNGSTWEPGPYREPTPPPGTREAIIEEALAILVQREPSLDIRPGSNVRTLIEATVGHLTPQELVLAQTTAREEYAEQVADDLTVHGTYANHEVPPMPEFRPSMLREMLETVERLRGSTPHDDRVDAFRYAMMLTRPPRPPSTSTNPCGEIPLGFMVHEEPGEIAVNPRAAERVRVPEFEIHSNPTVRIDDIRNRRFSGSGRIRKDPPLIEALIRHREKQYARPSAMQWEGDLTGSTAGPQVIEKIEQIERKSLWQRIIEGDDE